MNTKYTDLEFSSSDVKSDIKRLINQIWKLIPMKENGENWKKQLTQVINELIGLKNIFENQIDFLVILSGLEGILEWEEIPFIDFRSIVFSTISLMTNVNERLV
jgi:hypothetical protein